MLVLGIVLAALAFWVLYWFLQLGGPGGARRGSAAREEAAQQAMARRDAPLSAVTDQRDAAAILMVLIARTGADPTREQIAAIEHKLRTVGLEQEVTERMAHARLIARQAESFEQAARVLADLLNRTLAAEERGELVEMIGDIAGHDGPSEAQTEAIEALKSLLGLAPPPKGWSRRSG